MRVLFASTRGAGHFNPLVPFIEACRRRGHDVLVAGPPALAPAVEAAGYPFWVGGEPPKDALGAVWAHVSTVAPDEQNRIVIGEIFARLNVRAMLAPLIAACEEWGPDLVLRDPSEFASAVAAELTGVPHSRIAIGLARVEEDALRIAAAGVDEARRSVALAADPGAERILRSPYLTLFPASRDDPPIPQTQRFRDPAGAETLQPLPEWWSDRSAPLVYVTFGSVTGSLPIAADVYRTAIEAVAGLQAKVLLTVGRAVDPASFGELPANVHVEQWVPQAAVLGHAVAVVGHGGSGTTLGALAAGVPQIVMPLFADQPDNARRVAAVGAGLLVTPPDPAALRAAVERVLADDGYAAAAQRIADEMRRLPPVDDAFA